MKFSFDLEGWFPLNFSVMGEFDLSLSRFLRPSEPEECEVITYEAPEETAECVDREKMIREVMKIASLEEIPVVDFGCLAGHLDEDGLPTVFVCYGNIPLAADGEERHVQETCISHANSNSASATEALLGQWELHATVYKFHHDQSRFIYAITYVRTSLDEDDLEILEIDEETADDWVDSYDPDYEDEDDL